MSDSHALSGAYAVDALDDVERAAFERHLAGCASCRAEVADLRSTVSTLAHAVAVAPPAELRAAVLEGIQRVRPLPPVPAGSGMSGDGVGPEAARHRRWLPALVAAVLVLLVGVGGVLWHPWRDAEPQPTAAELVLADPDAQHYTQELPDGGAATIVRSEKLHRAVIVTEDMPPAPPGKVYQLWFQTPEEDMVSAGVMPPDETTVLLEGDADDAIGAGITVEPEGGSASPTSDPVLLFEFGESS